jgi:hypothetical protein
MAPPATRKAEPRLWESKGGVGRQMIEGAGKSRKQSRRRPRFGATRRYDDISRDSDGPVGLRGGGGLRIPLGACPIQRALRAWRCGALRSIVRWTRPHLRPRGSVGRGVHHVLSCHCRSISGPTARRYFRCHHICGLLARGRCAGSRQRRIFVSGWRRSFGQRARGRRHFLWTWRRRAFYWARRWMVFRRRRTAFLRGNRKPRSRIYGQWRGHHSRPW